MESGLLLWGVREGHWLLPIQGGAVSKELPATCRQFYDTDLTARVDCVTLNMPTLRMTLRHQLWAYLYAP